MQAPAVGSPAPNPDMLHMIGGPAGSSAADGQASSTGGAENQNVQSAQGSQTIQTPQGVRPETPPAAALPGAEPLPELPSVELPGLPLPELPLLRPDGNFHAFLQKLADTPRFSEAMNQLLLAFEPAQAGASEELDALLQLMPQDETQAAGLLKQQISGSSRFTGPLFDMLRDAYVHSPAKGAKTEILQFLRRFNDYTSAGHIERGMVRTLGQLAKCAPREYTAELETFGETLAQQFSEGDRAGALRLLQTKVLPFLRELGDRHPDMRLPNTWISIFKPLAARYENSGEEGLLQAFRQLAEHSVLKPRLGGRSMGELLKLVQESGDTRTKEEQRFAEQLAKTADWAMKGRGGGEPRRIFRQMVSNLLLNKSVYLPLEHALLPLEWNGRRLLAELWADPDAGRGQQGEDADGRLIRFLLHMDIPGLGPLDLILASRGEEVELQLACPASVVPFSTLIQGELTGILERNGLKASGIQVKKWEKPLTPAAAFPRIVQGDAGVNLKI